MKAKTIKKLVSIAAAALLFFVFYLNPFSLLEHRLQDAAYQQYGLRHPDILIIGIDEFTLYEFGRFEHWSRQRMAEAISILNSDPDPFDRPAVIAIDILFIEPGLIPEQDDVLVDAVRGSDNVVLASFFDVGIDRAALSLEPVILNHLRPIPGLLPYVSYGPVNGTTDSDGVKRSAMLREFFQGEVVYSFPVAIARTYADHWGIDLETNFLETHFETYIRYTDVPGAFFDLSFADIFDPHFDPIMYAGAIVMIGPYATAMQDHYAVPIMHGETMHGVEIHANVVQMLLDGVFKQHVSELTALLIVAALLILAMLMGELLDIRIALIVFVIMGVGYYFAALWIYGQGYVLPLLSPLLALAVVFLYQLIYEYVLQALEKGRLRSTFKKYVDPKLVDTLINSGEADSNEVGRKKHIAVLFVDVRGFTPMTEALRETPEKVVEILNEYLELTSSSVFNNGGSVDKFIGDATMALFNGFVPQEDYIYKSVKAAWDMILGAQAVNDSIKERLGIDIGFGVGVHCGEAIVGNLGPSFRKDYTAIGDTVNTAARLESSSARSQVLISQDVYEALEGRIEAESIGEVRLKGKSEPMEVYKLISVYS